MGLAVRDVPQALAFYRALFGQEATKERPGYAKFEVFDPPLNLSLNESPDAGTLPMPQHFGIQVKHRAAIAEIAGRMSEHGYAGAAEDQVTCCYAVQDKIWVTDPDGHRWELFLVTKADTAVHSEPGRSEPKSADPVAEERSCCAPTCCS